MSLLEDINKTPIAQAEPIAAKSAPVKIPAKPPKPTQKPKPDGPPSLHQTYAKLLLKCPRLAYLAHPDLGGEDNNQTAAMAKGSITERLISGFGEDEIAVVDADSFRTKDAREQRDAATEAGKTPVLAKDFEAHKASAEIIIQKIRAHFPDWADETMQVQRTLQWDFDGVACEGTLDLVWQKPDRIRIGDLKSCTSADPDFIERQVYQLGYYIQAATYTQAVETLFPDYAGRVEFVFIFYEVEPPHCVTPLSLDGTFRRMGELEWARAAKIWKECLRTGEWPEYVRPGEMVVAEAKPWQIAKIGEDEIVG